MPNHVMIDLETLVLKTNCVILSIGLFSFDIDKMVVDKDSGIEYFPNIEEQVNEGRTIDASTFMWWMKQDREAQRVLYEAKREPLKDILANCRWWLDANSGAQKYRKVWSNGSVFDIAILENLWGPRTPWVYWNVRDTRTLWDFCKTNKIKPALAHSALSDAIAQAEMVCDAYSQR